VKLERLAKSKMNDLIRSLGSTTPSASARKKQHVLDVDFSDPQTVRLNSPRGRLPASLGDGDALAAKLRDSKRLRTLQTMGSALRAERPQQPAAADPRTGLGSSWRVLDFSSSSADLGKSVASESNEKSQDAQVAGNDPRQTSQIGGWMSAPSQLTKSSKLWSRPTGRSLKDESSLGPKFAEPKVYTRGPPKTARLQVKRSQAAPSKYSSPYSFAQQSPKTPRTPIGTRRPATVGSKSSIPRLHVCPDGLFTAGYQPIPALMFSPQPRRTVAEDIVATKRLHTPQSSRKITLHSPLTRKMCNAPDLCADAAEGAERAEHLGRVARKYLRPNGNLADMSLSTDGENQHDQHVEDGNIDEDDSAHAITLLHSGTAHSPLPGVDGSTDESPHGLIQQSLMYALAGQFEEALKCAQEAANILPEDPMVWMRLGKAYQGLGQWAEAETAILRGLELDPTEETLHSSHKEIKVSLLKERGQQHMKAGLPDKAITAFSEALEFANETDKCWLMNQRSRLYFSKQDFVSAAEDAGACVKLNPDLMEAYERHCDSLIAMGDFESAKVTAQNGLQHAPNLKNQVLDNCLERLATGALPKTSTARVFVKQVLKQETCEELSRILSLWDKTLRVEMHHRVMTLWKAQVKLKNTSNKVPLPSPLAALKNAATTVSKNASFLGHLSKRVSAADLQTLGNFTQSSNSLAENSMDPSFSPMDFNTSFRSISRTSSTFSMGSQVDGRDLVQKIMDVCKECFKCSLSKNRSLFLDMAIFGWRQALTAIDFEDKKELAGINLQLGFALLEKVQGGESIEEERLCIETLQKAIDLLQDGEVAAQRVAAQVGLAQIYQIRQEGDRVDNLLEAAAQLQNTLSFCTYDEDPHRFIAVHHEIGDVYGAAGQWTLATLFLSSALKLLEEPGCTSWNTLSGIKFLRAVTHCKLAEVVIAANDDLDPENDPRFQLNISKAIEHYEFALQVFVLHHYPMDYSRTVARLCHLRGMSGSNSIFANNGIVCLHQGQRTKLLHAYKGFQDALATAEAIAITLFTRDDERLAVNAEDILSIVAQCFSGCIQMSIRLGMYAQALGYSERAHAYPILKELLQEPCRQELFEGLPAHMLTRFNELSKNLSQYRTALAIDVPSSSNFSGMLSEAVQMLKLLEDMAAYTEICSNEKLRLLGMIIPKVREVPCVFLEDPVQDCETAVVEFFWNPSCFYVFVQCWKEDCPKTIEYTAKQIKIITENVDALQLPGAKDPEYAKSMRSKRKESAADGKDGDFMRSLEAISKALKIDTVLKAVPSCVRRLIIVPHGKLMAVSHGVRKYVCFQMTQCLLRLWCVIDRCPSICSLLVSQRTFLKCPVKRYLVLRLRLTVFQNYRTRCRGVISS
jgi:tetratricopeptide (TPR) repeat protein